MGRRRQPSCKLTAQEAGRLFPAEQHPLPECVLCHLSRSDGTQFFCGMTERLKGRYVNRPSLSEREVKLARGVVVDGNPMPAGTVLKLVGGKASGRVWCRYLQGRATPKPFQVKKEDIDFGNELTEVEIEEKIEMVLIRAIQIGKLMFPRYGKNREPTMSLLVDGEWISVEDIEPYSGALVTRLRLPLWLAREKGL